MADIFISYAREDRTFVRWLADAFAREGWNVWWDRELAAGEEFPAVIQKKLAEARCIIVLWSQASIGSRWVQAEATEGFDGDRLVPAAIGGVRPPLPFGRLHTVDLSDWRGDPTHPGLQSLLQAAARLLEPRGLGEGPHPTFFAPPIDPHRFSVAVARLEGDIGDQMQDVIKEDLLEFDGVQVVKVEKSIAAEGSIPERSLFTAEELARDYLENLGATLLIWGKILRFAGKEVPQLHLTVSRNTERRRGRYVPTDELRLPPVFWQELATILHLVIRTYVADFEEQEGHYLAGQLRPFIVRVRCLLETADERRGWSADACGLARIHLADALMLLGSQAGENEPLEEAIGVYQRAASALPRSRAPLDWARAQNGLGIASWTLGKRIGSAALVTQALGAYEQAIEERSRARTPIDWAQTMNDLGNALLTVGQWEAGTSRLQQAVQAYAAALGERTRELRPLDWAQTQNNLGVALLRLGERENGAKRLEEAMVAIKASLSVYTPVRTPLDWAQAQNNLGLVLWAFGRSHGSAARLEDAVRTFRAALRKRPRRQVPHLWAQTQNNLGLALWAFGDLQKEEKLLLEAVQAFRRALRERTPDRGAREWAQTQNNLGAALWTLGQITGHTEQLEQAIEAYSRALSVYSREDTPREWARAMHNLGNALACLGERLNDTARLEQAACALVSALSVYDPVCEPVPCAEMRCDLAHALAALGELQGDCEGLERSARAFEEAGVVFRDAGLIESAEHCAQQARRLMN